MSEEGKPPENDSAFNSAIIQPKVKKNRLGRGLGKPFKKGQSGNPKGKPPGTISITSSIKAKLMETYPAKEGATNEEKKTYLDKLIESIMSNALENGEARTQKDIWNYIDGFPKATIDIGADKDSLGALTEFFRGVAKKKK